MLSIRKIESGYGHLSLDEIDVPVAGAGEVCLRVSAAGICGTDMHIYRGAPFAERLKLPTVLGHEMSGFVDSVGAGVKRVQAGDFVTVESHIPCGACRSCRTGRAHICPNTRYPGIDLDGGFAHFVVLPETIAMPLPSGIAPHIAALFEPFGIAVHACLEGSGVAGQDVLITGCGPIGLMNVMAARSLGAHRVFASDIAPTRLAQAEKAGADVIIDAHSQNTVEVVRTMTGGNGVDVMFEYSGAAESIAMAVDCIVPGGELRLLGVPDGSPSIPFERWLMRGLVVRSIHGRRLFETWERAIAMVTDHKVDLQPLISHVLPLSEGLRGFDLIERGEAIKVLFEPD